MSFTSIVNVLKRSVPAVLKKQLRSKLESLQNISLRIALREQGLWKLYNQLAVIVPDLSKQYTALRLTRKISYCESGVCMHSKLI
jgi:hypothetical protein